MTIGDSRVEDLNSLFNNIFEDAVFILHEETLAVRLVKNFTNGRGDQTRKLSEYPAVTPVTVAETEDFAAPTRFDKTLRNTLTPGEKMSQMIITDRRIETDPQEVRSDGAMEMSRGFSTQVDQDVFGNFTSLTAGTTGSAGSTMTWGYFNAAISIMREAKIPRPWRCVLHPFHWHYMAESGMIASTVTNAPMLQDKIAAQWFVGNVGGVDIFVSTNVPDSSTDAVSAMFNPQAIAFDVRRPYRLEPERDASKRAWELNSTMLYAHGAWRDNWGVQIIADAQTVS